MPFPILAVVLKHVKMMRAARFSANKVVPPWNAVLPAIFVAQRHYAGYQQVAIVIGSPLNVGDEVKFARPLTEDERIERFMVVELRGDRALVAMKDSGMAIVPTFVYLQADLTTV